MPSVACPDPTRAAVEPRLPAGVRQGPGGASSRPWETSISPRTRSSRRPGRRARAVAEGRRAAQSRGVDHTRPRGARPSTACATARRSTRRPAYLKVLAELEASEHEEEEETSVPDERLRPLFTCCHPAPGPAGACGLDAAHARRAHHAGDRARLPGARDHARAAAGAGQAQDPRRGHPPTACLLPSCCRSDLVACCTCST